MATNKFSYTLKVLILLSLPGLLLKPAWAEIDFTGLYTGFQYSTSHYIIQANSGSDIDLNWGHMKVKVGKILNDDFSIEGQVGLTSNTSSKEGVMTYGAYVRYGKDLGKYKPYALGGLTGLYLYEDGSDDVNEFSGSLGAGIEIFGSTDLALTLEYMLMLKKSVDSGDLTYDSIGLGFTYYFTGDTSYFNKNRNKIRSIRY